MVAFSNSSTANIDENTNGTFGYDAEVTGAIGTITYLLSGADQGLFTLDSVTGVLTLTNPSDYEDLLNSDHKFDVKVSAFDSGETKIYTQDVVVDINDVNEAPSSLDYSALVTNFDETDDTSVAIKVGSFSYSDDALGTETATLTGADASLFTIVGTDIFLNAGAELDFEANPLLNVTIEVKDGSFPTLTKSFAIDVNDIAPALEPSQTLADVDENSNFVFNVVDPTGDTTSVTYGISTDKDGAFFKIDSAGNLSFITPPDFENPQDAGGDNTYVVNVTATDDVKGVAEISQYTITVKDLNDVAPNVTSLATANVNEGVTTAYTITSSGDVDTTGEATVYSISGTDAALFDVDSSTGVVTFKAAPDYEAATDAGANHVYDIVVKASDGVNFTTKSVAITVNDLNDNAPVITSAATANASENQTTAYDANATDVDTVGGPIAYSIVGGADQSLFSINASTGVVTFIAAPNFELPGDSGGDNVYDIVVQAKDAGGNLDTQAVAITVTDVNDVAPNVTSLATANVNEGVTTAYTITSSGDIDTTGEATVYSISGTDAALFDVDSSTGVVTFKAAPDYEAATDAGANHVYDIVVKASDGVNFTTKSVAITVNDLNDNAPVFTSSTTKTVNENQTAVMTVTTSDADTVGTNPATFTITGGADQALFSITTGGILTFIAPPDFETKADAGADGIYDVQVTANDGTNTTVQNIAVTVADVNEAPTGVVVNLSVPAVSESNSSKLLVGSYTVTDDALGSENITLTGADASLLEISGGNIYIKAGALLDHETNPTLDFVVNAQDPLVGGLVSSSAQSITISDAAPKLLASVGNVVENTTAVGNVVDITGDHSGIIYGISDSDDGALFAVDAAGNLSFISAPDFENPLDIGADNTYTVTVTADDGSGNLAAHAYTFSVTDVAGGTFNGNGSNNTLNGTGEADTINGNGGNDTLNGLAGNDILNGGSGNDTMSGGAGNDTYFVDSTSDQAIENFGEGIDTVNSTENFTLGANVENLTLQGTGNNRTGTGNALDNVLTGHTGNNVLNGLDGADTLIGGLGKDTLTGGTGNDTFDFNVILDSRARPNHDIITDFNNGDIIDLSDIAGLNAVSGLGGVVANSVSWSLVSGNTIISIETTGNGVADMEIQLNGDKTGILDAGDFLI